MSGIKNTVIFDLDGTLLNTLDDLTDSINYTMNVFGYPERTLQEVRRFVGNGLDMLVRRAVPKYVSDAQCEVVLAEMKNYYTEHCNNKTRPYDGIIDLLETLKKAGIKMAIVSNKADSAVKKLNGIYFGDNIETAIGSRINVLKKPAPDSIYEALKELGSNIDEAIYIGDSEVDIKTSQNAGIDALFVTWGFRDREQLIESGAKILVDNTDEILKNIGL